MTAAKFLYSGKQPPDPNSAENRSESRAGELQQAVTSWQRELGEAKVLRESETIRLYQASTTGVERRVPTVLLPRDAGEVQSIVRIANRHRIPLYPISTGHNWGYGSANPVLNDCVIVDLSGMDRIEAFDADSGLVTVEPGVTQQRMWDFLQENAAGFYVPVHGGGPDCSLLGNALERGYGITPHADHFAAITSLEAVLPSGEVYRSALDELGGGEVARAFKWGLGPYVDGLFTQGNFGIVTRGTIALAPAARSTAGFFFSVASEERLNEVVAAVQATLRSLGSLCSSINLMNARRILSMIEPYPHGHVAAGEAIPQTMIDRLARQQGVACWTGVGALYGDPRMIRAASAVIRRELRPLTRQLVFLNQRKLRAVDSLLRLVPFASARRLRSRLAATRQFLNIVSGKPERTALPLAYWKSAVQPSTDDPLDPARDRCGLIWYSPLVPMKPERVRAYVDHVERTCSRHGLDPLITLTSLSPHVFDSTVPLLFRQDDRDEAERAHACYQELFDRGAELGFVPYRVGVQHMDKVVAREAPYWKMVAKIKQAVDPHDIMAPGRYAPTGRQARPEQADPTRD